MKIAIGADHGGVDLKKEVIDSLEKNGYEVINFGTDTHDAVDYPDIAEKVALAVKDGKADRGILICGTGIGISIAANKIPGIRCALLSDVFSAKATREHNDANIIAMGARVVGPGLAVKIVDTFLHTEFSGEERHINRIRQIEEDME